MKIAIIGNGIAGVTAARHIRKYSNDEIFIISSESSYFFSRTALMYVYMGQMKFENTQVYENDFWEKNRINLIFQHVEAINFQNNKLIFSNGETFSYDKLILAIGSKPKFKSWKGLEYNGVQGLYSKQDLEKMEFATKNCNEAIVVGGGLIGIEMVEMLLSRGIKVHFLIREKLFWDSVLPFEDAKFLKNYFEKIQNLTIHYQDELDEIIGNTDGHVIAIKTISGKELKTTFVGISIGVTPNIDFLINTDLEINDGILVNEYLETSIENVYAIGDCAEMKHSQVGRKKIEQVWYTGKLMGETLAKSICLKKTKYEPGNWFNSAKFFEIEYQTYGLVSPQLEKNQSRFIWKKESKNILVDFVYDTIGRKFIGVNSFGIRLRHELIDAWLNQEKSIEFVLENLKTANFDPEFYDRYEQEIIQQFNSENNTSLQLKSKKWWKTLLQS